MLSYLEVENGFIEISKLTGQSFSTEWTPLPNNVRLRMLDVGVLQVKPAAQSHSDMVISCGIHGNETAPIEIVSGLISQIVTGAIEPKVNLLFILGNPESMKISERFVSINMNRLFDGAHANYELNEENRYELERAERLESLVTSFYGEHQGNCRMHLDLHTAIKPSFHKTFAIRPFENSPITDDSRKLLVAMGIEAVLQHNKPSTTFSYFSVKRFYAEAYTLELGKVKPFGENNPEDFAAAINCLQNLIKGEAVEEPDVGALIEYKVVAEIIRNSDDFKFYVPDDVENFTAYPQGYLIAEDVDYNYRVAFEEESVVFPNTNVPVGQRVAVMVTKANQG
ncbi:succinylglutamate desuccinylase [Aliikangiella coralliicola]|uniref:Succinylglutamate desuccinylase n=1 Tax=Aliikangiella coralliicola TaxID=2592383 RepID=A0A545UD07_9GAMM|nr:succinylglutamate desuccinylase [Aliikangiella coralliicola]TQV87350.1 succinylglutamate desuccinylase [Aliikangiella coralliicola]